MDGMLVAESVRDHLHKILRNHHLHRALVRKKLPRTSYVAEFMNTGAYSAIPRLTLTVRSNLKPKRYVFIKLYADFAEVSAEDSLNSRALRGPGTGSFQTFGDIPYSDPLVFMKIGKIIDTSLGTTVTQYL